MPKRERQRDEAADRLGVGHGDRAGLAERREDLERLTRVVLVDRHVHVAERRFIFRVVPRSSCRAAALLPAELLRLRLRGRRAILRALHLQPAGRQSIAWSSATSPASSACCAGVFVAPVESTWLSREPSRYTVTPLQFSSYASS